ncbi:MAG TPA: hypothetical protein VGH32_00870, partial [Pirellulales bacterium]
MQLQLCPNCERRVVFSPNGECPSCRKTWSSANGVESPSDAGDQQTALTPSSHLADNDPSPAATENPYASPLTKSDARVRDSALVARPRYPLAPRFWAAQIDFIVAIILSLIVGKQLEDFGQLIQLIAVLV